MAPFLSMNERSKTDVGNLNPGPGSYANELKNAGHSYKEKMSNNFVTTVRLFI